MERDKTGRLSPGWQWKRDTGTSRAVARAGQRECVSLQWSLLPLSSLPSLPTTHALLKFFQGPGKEKETYKYWSSGALPVSKYVVIIWSSLFGDRRWEWSTSLPRWRNWDAKKWNHLFRVNMKWAKRCSWDPENVLSRCWFVGVLHLRSVSCKSKIYAHFHLLCLQKFFRNLSGQILTI